MNLAFSSGVWKRPWPNLDDVSMNLRLISSICTREKFACKERRKVRHRFRDPATQPLSMSQSSLIIP